MLTKDLLRHRRRGDKVVPTFVDPSDKGLLESASILIETFEDAAGLETAELEDRLGLLKLGHHEIKAGLEKLLMDRCEFVEDDGTAEELRWQIFDTAERLRRGQTFADKSDFEKVLSLTADHELESLKLKLYADLPEHRKILAFATLSPEDLLHRYNCALIQGLLLRSSRVVITAPGLGIGDKRRLGRQSLRLLPRDPAPHGRRAEEPGRLHALELPSYGRPASSTHERRKLRISSVLRLLRALPRLPLLRVPPVGDQCRDARRA